MVKADLSRDYYADLELPPTADVGEIKRQFRKLALRFHPDRNPGREAEVNAKFQTIQSAHEVLTSPDQKSRYDAHRTRTTRHATGNPYQNVSAQYPPPPKRPNMSSTRASSSGANRFPRPTSNVPPPTTPKPPQGDPSSRYRAWENMRASAKAKASATFAKTAGTSNANAGAEPTRPKPPPTAFQRQKAEASFGARKSGFAPKSPAGDEPPVSSSNYSTTRMHTNMFNDISADARRARRASSNAGPTDMFRDSFLDPRQSTPYQTRGGEKLNPFDGVNLGRAKSTRENPRAKDDDSGAAANAHRRSSSAPGDPDNFPQSNGPRAGVGVNGGLSGTQYGSQSQPHGQGEAAPAAAGTGPKAAFASTDGDYATQGGPKATADTGYTSFSNFLSSSYSCRGKSRAARHSSHGPSYGGFDRARWYNLPPEVEPMFAQKGPSGAQEDHGSTLNAFETKQFRILHEIINKNPPLAADAKSSSGAGDTRRPSGKVDNEADRHRRNSVRVPVPETPPPSSSAANAHRFMRNSADSINTRFVAEEHSNTQWRFNAGGPTGESPARSGAASGRRSQSGNRRGRSPPKGRAQPLNRPGEGPANGSGGGAPLNAFDPGQWATKIGSEHFVPQPPQPSVSPSRPIRPTKKGRNVLKTAGTAGLVNDQDTSSGDDKTGPASSTGNLDGEGHSPNAMDIDPPVEPAAVPGMGSARNIPVEPSRPEWRAGDVIGAKPDVAPSSAHGSAAFSTNNSAGSEDNDDFRTSFKDFKNVAPFADAPTVGLGSLDDLKSNLPFESKASARIPIKKPAQKGSIKFPKPPLAPRPPATLAVPGLTPGGTAWSTYVRDFEQYMQKWTTFNGLYVDHFAARRGEIEKQRRAGGGFPWLSMRGDAGIQEYAEWLEQDKEIRAKWDEAASDHEKRVREFMAYRERMLK